MSTKNIGLLVGARDGKKLGSSWDPVNSTPSLSKPGPFQTFAYFFQVFDVLNFFDFFLEFFILFKVTKVTTKSY